jgi:hypothetical protein
MCKANEPREKETIRSRTFVSTPQHCRSLLVVEKRTSRNITQRVGQEKKKTHKKETGTSSAGTTSFLTMCYHFGDASKGVEAAKNATVFFDIQE